MSNRWNVDSEQDVRTWARTWASPAAIFIEPAMGSTFGAPDFLDWFKGSDEKNYAIPIALELKKGKFNGECLKFRVRPAQKDVLCKMKSNGVVVGVAVGVIGTPSVGILRVTDDVLGGCVQWPGPDVLGECSIRGGSDIRWIFETLTR